MVAKDRLTLVVPDRIRVEAKVKALREGVALSSIVSALLEMWTSGQVSIPPEILGDLEARKP